MWKIQEKFFLLINKYSEINDKSYWLIFFFILILLAGLPIFSVNFLPMTDLPQHLAQVHLFYKNLYQPSSEYEINLFMPNLLVYWLMILLWKIVNPIMTGQIIAFIIATLWIMAIFLLGYNTNRSLPLVIISSTLVFNTSFYWGFINFLIGFFFFVLLLILLEKKKEVNWFLVAKIFTLGLLLFFSHVLWFLAGMIYTILSSSFSKNSFKESLAKIAGLVPISIISFSWFVYFNKALGATEFLLTPSWIVSPISRLSPGWILENTYGGIKSPITAFLLLIIILWIVVTILFNIKTSKRKINLNLFRISVLLFLVVLFAPQLVENTILFGSRWFAPAILLLLFSLPKPKINESILSVIFTAIFFVFIIETKSKWKDFESIELSGLTDSINKIEKNSKIIGLAYFQSSNFIYGKPFMQIFAYAQILKNCELNFTFALHQNGIVTTKNFEKYKQWTPGLEWIPEYVRYEDLSKFDFALIGTTDEIHNYFSEDEIFQPITKTGNWRLYKCNKNLNKKGFLFLLQIIDEKK